MAENRIEKNLIEQNGMFIYMGGRHAQFEVASKEKIAEAYQAMKYAKKLVAQKEKYNDQIEALNKEFVQLQDRITTLASAMNQHQYLDDVQLKLIHDLVQLEIRCCDIKKAIEVKEQKIDDIIKSLDEIDSHKDYNIKVFENTGIFHDFTRAINVAKAKTTIGVKDFSRMSGHKVAKFVGAKKTKLKEALRNKLADKFTANKAAEKYERKLLKTEDKLEVTWESVLGAKDHFQSQFEAAYKNLSNDLEAPRYSIENLDNLKKAAINYYNVSKKYVRQSHKADYLAYRTECLDLLKKYQTSTTDGIITLKVGNETYEIREKHKVSDMMDVYNTIVDFEASLLVDKAAESIDPETEQIVADKENQSEPIAQIIDAPAIAPMSYVEMKKRTEAMKAEATRPQENVEKTDTANVVNEIEAEITTLQSRYRSQEADNIRKGVIFDPELENLQQQINNLNNEIQHEQMNNVIAEEPKEARVKSATENEIESEIQALQSRYNSKVANNQRNGTWYDPELDTLQAQIDHLQAELKHEQEVTDRQGVMEMSKSVEPTPIIVDMPKVEQENKSEPQVASNAQSPQNDPVLENDKKAFPNWSEEDLKRDNAILEEINSKYPDPSKLSGSEKSAYEALVQEHGEILDRNPINVNISPERQWLDEQMDQTPMMFMPNGDQVPEDPYRAKLLEAMDAAEIAIDYEQFRNLKAEYEKTYGTLEGEKTQSKVK